MEVAENGNHNACSDADAGAQLAQTALRIAALNVRINARDVSNREAVAQSLRQLEDIETGSRILVERAEAAMRALLETA